MSDVADADREKARAMVVEWTRGENPWLTDAIAAALAEERERERATWNPMIGRVIQVAQAWARTPLPIWTDKAAERINRAIEGAE